MALNFTVLAVPAVTSTTFDYDLAGNLTEVTPSQDTSSDPQNCGTIGNACPSGTTCCFGQCVALGSDRNNCGRCGNACGCTTAMCASGLCQ